MKIYHYTPDGQYIGEGDAERCPVTGQPMIPAFATDQAPPTPSATQKVIWQNGTWIVQDIPQPEPDPQPTLEEIQQQANSVVISQISDLEAKQHRAVREYILGDTTAQQRIKDIDIQISSLRAQLK